MGKTKTVTFKEIPSHDIYLEFFPCQACMDELVVAETNPIRIKVFEILDIGNPICEDCGEELEYKCTLMATLEESK